MECHTILSIEKRVGGIVASESEQEFVKDITVGNGKYRFVMDKNGKVECYRIGDLSWDMGFCEKGVLALMMEVECLRGVRPSVAEETG